MQYDAGRALSLLSACFSLVVLLVLTSSTARAQETETHRIVVIPDTQAYAIIDGGDITVQAQFDWVAAQADPSNTILVSAVGDVVQNPNSTAQWDLLEPGYITLEEANLPYGISPGNHDLVDGGGPVEFDVRFGLDRFAGQPWFGGNHQAEASRSTYQYVSMPGHDVLFVHVRHLKEEYGDVDAVIDWVDEVLEEHPDHLVFVTTHEFTGSSGSVRIPELQEVIAEHCNVAVVFSGHRSGEAARGTFDDECDRTVHHVLTNYQFIENGGDGFLRTVDIDPLTLTADFAVYSPTLDTARTGVDELFTVDLSKLIPVSGDVNCDRVSDVVDAMAIAQFQVTNRAAYASCPLQSPTTQLNPAEADRNGDLQVNIVDALIISMCDVGIDNEFCDEDEDDDD